MAKWMFFESRPSTGKSRGLVAPTASTMESFSARSCSTSTSTPMFAFTTNLTPSASIRSTRRCTMFVLDAFILGMPYIISPPMRSARSYTVTLCPILFSWSAAASPAGPEPMTATFLSVRVRGGRGTIHPLSQALSMMDISMDLMVTGFSLMPSTHAPSHGAGHTRPVNSGKLLVLISTSSACFHRPWCTSSLNSGTRFPSGHPDPGW
mmetsp:Transcript_21023/g.39974  ORF Transcript_21023/g.39974 Transcript_21023/m.39974 type:complete len:208 (-) Transcript_21023:5404-6027(-)